MVKLKHISCSRYDFFVNVTPENYDEFRQSIENDANLDDETKSMILDDVIESLEEQTLRGRLV